MLFLIKYPTAGQVKTRLGTTMGMEKSARLYQSFVEYLIERLRKLEAHLLVYFAPSDKKKDFELWLGEDLTYLAQQGKNLGERLIYGFEQAFSLGAKRVVALGSDAPDVPEDSLRSALCSDHPVVVGPTEDGGYYTIGFSREAFSRDVFLDIPWSTEGVFDATLATVQSHNLSAHLLSPWWDIDTEADFQAFLKRCPDFFGKDEV